MYKLGHVEGRSLTMLHLINTARTDRTVQPLIQVRLSFYFYILPDVLFCHWTSFWCLFWVMPAMGTSGFDAPSVSVASVSFDLEHLCWCRSTGFFLTLTDLKCACTRMCVCMHTCMCVVVKTGSTPTASPYQYWRLVTKQNYTQKLQSVMLYNIAYLSM